MELSVTGISHRTAPVAVRERFAFDPDELPPALQSMKPVLGSVAVLSTCNRTEAYVASSAPLAALDVATALAEARGLSVPEALPFYHLSGLDAARHLYRVSAGIESLVLGEHEILGQVRTAFTAATAAHTSNGLLARLFHSAIRTGRRARAETAIGHHGLSVSATAVALSRQTLGDLSRKTVLVVGAGEAGRLAAAALVQQAAGRLLVTTRTFERARDIAVELGGSAYPFEELASILVEADIVISSTSAPGHVIGRDDVAHAMAARSGRPLVIVDIAVPRDVDPDVRTVPAVRLFDIDDLEAAAEANREARALEIPAVEAIVEQELARFDSHYRSLGVEPTIAALRRRAEATRRTELERTLARLPGISEADQRRIDAMTKALVKRLLHDPVTELREGDGRHADAARELFRLDE